MKITARAVLAAVIVSAMGLLSGVASAQQQPSAAAIAAARQLLELKGAFALYTDAVPKLIDQVKVHLVETNLNYQKDLNEIGTKMSQDLKGRDSEMGDEMARIYATTFTEQELKDMLAFYKSPVGQKMQAQEPKAINASLQYMQNWSQRFGDEVDGKFREEMKKRGKPIT